MPFWLMKTCKFLVKPLHPFSEIHASWRKMRRAAHEGFNVRASTSYQPLQEKESALLVSHMLQDPNGWDDHLKR